MDYKSLLENSIKKHQQLVNELVAAQNDEGISCISQTELAERMKRSSTRISQMIRQLNVEDICVEQVAPGKYVVHYQNILEQGVYQKIMMLMIETMLDPNLSTEKDSVLAERYGIKLKTVQMYKAFLKTGWRENNGYSRRKDY